MAFPTTGILDDFNRADATPASANWDYHLNSTFWGCPPISVISNQGGLATSNYGDSYWAAATFGPDVEVYATVAALPGSGTDQFLEFRIQSPGTGGTAPADGDSYGVSFKNTAPDELMFYRCDNSSYTQLGATQTPGNLSVGDKIGVEMIGDTIQAYRYTGGAWAAYGSPETDSTYTVAGYIGGGFGDYIGRWDDFGGGTVVTGGGGGKIQRWMMMGVT